MSEIYISYCLHFTDHLFKSTWVSQYLNVSVLDFIGAKDDGGGGDNVSYKTLRAKLQSNSHHQQTDPSFTG